MVTKFEISAAKKQLKERIKMSPHQMGEYCVIDPEGKVYPCPIAGHRLVLLTLGLTEIEADNLGYLKITDDMYRCNTKVLFEKKPTQAQINAVYKVLGEDPNDPYWKTFIEQVQD